MSEEDYVALENEFKDILLKYSDSVDEIRDLIGDNEPSKIFSFLIEKLGYLLDNDPKNVLSKNSLIIRQKLNKLFKLVGPLFLSCAQTIENREALKQGIFTGEPDKGIILPNESVIWMPNHHFKDDVLASVLAAYRNAYILFGSLPQFYNTIDGLTAWINGVVMVNRKNKLSRRSSLEKEKYAIDLGADLIIYPEGVWNKTPNQLILHLWPGIYRIAKEKNLKIVPIVHYIDKPYVMSKSNTIRTVVDDPVSVDGMSEKAALEYLRDILAYWYYLLLEKYGKATREELLQGFSSSEEAWEYYLKERINTAARYDKSIELSADYRPKGIILPEDVYSPIANIENITPQNAKLVLGARKIVEDSKRNDFQRRF